ncbi:MAG: hypothetical protein LBM87_02880 [Ruminococcus sp.]|jgi:hypothetical protein|nr:hypothetical protein [Ruminococcus sp.]
MIKFLKIIPLILLLMTGCVNASLQVNERAFVQLIGIEREFLGGNYVVTLQLYSDNSDGETKNDVIQGEGETISAAVANAELKQGRKLFLGHLKLFVIGRGIIDVSHEFSYFLSGDITPACPVVYAENPLEIAEAENKNGAFSADELLKLLNVFEGDGKTVITPLTKVVTSGAESFTAAAIPVLTAEAGEVTVNGMTLVGRGGIYGELDNEAALGIALLGGYDSIKSVTVPVTVGEKKAAAVILSEKTELDVRFDKVYTLDVNCKIKCDVIENPYGLSEHAILEAVLRYVDSQIYKAFAVSAWEEEKDVFGIAKLLRKKSDGQYKAFLRSPREFLRGAGVDIEVRC